MFPSFNDIGDILAKTKPESYPLDAIDENDVMIRAGIFKKTDTDYRFDRKGLERAIAGKFGIQTQLIHTGNVCSFGTIRGAAALLQQQP